MNLEGRLERITSNPSPFYPLPTRPDFSYTPH